VAATLKLPPGWKFGTALPLAAITENTLTFAPAPLETLVDSPVIAGEFLYTAELTPGEPVRHFLHIVADSGDDLSKLASDAEHFAHLANLVHEEEAIFGARHFRAYHFLLTASDDVAHFGLEHHESSDDRVGAEYLTDGDARRGNSGLLPHEMFHSWNGKYRRPAGLATPDFQQPMKGELLWVYEGLTTYYGAVLASRSGLETSDRFREGLAGTAAMLDRRAGRQWRPLADTAVAAQLVYRAPGEGVSRRRGTDFYPEGELVWLEADTLIRQQTQGKRSLDDFCRRFEGGENSGPKVVPYTYEDVVWTLNEVLPYDWNNFFQKRVYAISEHAPAGGIESGGWRLAWTNGVPEGLKGSEDRGKFTSLDYSLGFSLGSDGGIGDVLPGSPADQAGILQGMRLVAVNRHGWSAKLVRAALREAATNNAPIALLTVREDDYRICEVNYHGGEKYPVLERVAGKPDLLAEIVRPLTPPAATNSPAAK
jgi:predicted metalloprotease with PDZ domain